MLLCVGCGSMGSAIIAGALENGFLQAQDLVIVDRHPEKLKPFAERGCQVLTSLDELENCFSVDKDGAFRANAEAGAVFVESSNAETKVEIITDPQTDVRTKGTTDVNAETNTKPHFDTILYALKPQAMREFFSQYKTLCKNSLFISIAVGITTEIIKTLSDADELNIRIVRAMPNLGVGIAKGATALCADEMVLQEDISSAQDLFNTLGCTQVIPEKNMDIAGVVSGSSPAFFAFFVDCLTQSAIEHGMSAVAARDLIVQTMEGTAALMRKEEMIPAELCEKVSSPGGTTIAGLQKLQELRLPIREAVNASYQKSQEMR